jgi:hypothetical protein
MSNFEKRVGYIHLVRTSLHFSVFKKLICIHKQIYIYLDKQGAKCSRFFLFFCFITNKISRLGIGKKFKKTKKLLTKQTFLMLKL